MKIFSTMRSHLTLAVLLVLVPLVVLVVYNNLEQRHQARQDARDSVVALTLAIASREEQSLEAARQLLVTLETLPEIRALDASACQQRLTEIRDKLVSYGNFGLIGTNGDVICSESATPGTTPGNVAERPYFVRAMATGDFAVGDYLPSRTSASRSVHVARPFKDAQGRILGVVFARIDLDWLDANVIGQLDLPRGAVFTLFDRMGTIIARNPDGHRWIGQAAPEGELFRLVSSQPQGVGEVRGVDGVQRLYAFTRVSSGTGTAFYAATGIPTSVAYAAVDSNTRRSLILLAVVAVGALGASWLISGLMVIRPAKRLLALTNRIGAGDLSARSEVTSRVGELNQIARAIDAMASALERRERLRERAEVDREQARRDLELLNESLEQKVRERTAQIEHANEWLRSEIEERRRTEDLLERQAAQLTHINAELDDFTHVVSHDLKEPLRGIAGFNALLLEDCGDQLDARGKRYVGIINDSALKMRRLIDDLLELSRIGRVNGDVVDVASSQLVTEVVTELEFAIAEKSARLHIQRDLPVIRCDSERFKQVLRNLISNSLKYNDKPWPEIHISWSRHEDELTFAVEDNGMGIDPRYQEKVFGVFQRLERRDGVEGTGVGLTICRKIVQSWGGRMWVESQPGKGATFFFTMPAVEGPANQEESLERAA